MNVIVDPKSVRPVEVTTGPISGSRKVYATVDGLSVPLREIPLHPRAGEPPARVYDSSGPYTEDAPEIDVERGLARTREAWVMARGVESYQGRDVKPEDNGNAGKALAREFPIRNQPMRAGEGTPITQLELA